MNRHERRKNKGKGVEDTNFFNNLSEAINTHKSRDFNSAEKLYKKLLSTHPNSYELNRHVGILYQDTGRSENSFDFFVKCIKKNPNGFEAYNNMGASYVIVKDYELAVKCFNKSISISNNYLPALNNLANLYSRRGDGENALKFSKIINEKNPNNPQTICTYAKALILNHDLKQALKLMEQLASEFPENEEFQINLATAYRENGDFKKSKKIIDEGFQKLLDKRLKGIAVKNLIQFFAQYASDKSNKLKENEISFFAERLNSKEVNIDQKITIAKGFFEYFKNQKDFSKSYEYLEKMNSFCFELEKYNIKKDKVFFDKLSQNFAYPSFDKSKSSITPVFICGMPRSGTTLCEQILSAHSDVFGAGELRYMMQLTNLQDIVQPDDNAIDNYFTSLTKKEFLKKIRDEYLKMIGDLNKENVRFISDKMPHNFLLIDLIRHILPEAKIIYCKRKAEDNCFSLLTQRFVEGRHHYCYNQRTLANYYLLHEELMNIWLKKFKDEIFVLDNEELVNNQKDVTINLLKFCGLEWEDSCMEFYKSKRQVRTASLEQVRQPINKKSIGAWKNYEPYLTQMINTLKQK